MAWIDHGEHYCGGRLLFDPDLESHWCSQCDIEILDEQCGICMEDEE